jgi:hypothetical protein
MSYAFGSLSARTQYPFRCLLVRHRYHGDAPAFSGEGRWIHPARARTSSSQMRQQGAIFNCLSVNPLGTTRVFRPPRRDFKPS